jgi:hypothetical protein
LPNRLVSGIEGEGEIPVTANRREVLRGAGAIALAGALPALAGCDASAQRAARPPNNRVLHADGLGYCDVGC